MKATEHSLYLQLNGETALFYRQGALDALVAQEVPEHVLSQRQAILNALHDPLLQHTTSWRARLAVTLNGQLYREETQLGHPAGKVFEINYCISQDTPVSPVFAGEEEVMSHVPALVQDYLIDARGYHSEPVDKGLAVAVHNLCKLFGEHYKVHLMENEISLSITWFPKDKHQHLTFNIMLTRVTMTNTIDSGLSDDEYLPLQLH